MELQLALEALYKCISGDKRGRFCSGDVAAADADAGECCEHLCYGSGPDGPEQAAPTAVPAAGGGGGGCSEFSWARAMLFPPSLAHAMTRQPPKPFSSAEASHLLLCFTAD